MDGGPAGLWLWGWTVSDEASLIAALKRFGWEGGPEFFRRYYSDPWVFNLANAVERLTDERDQLLDALNSAQGGPSERDVEAAYFAGRDGG